MFINKKRFFYLILLVFFFPATICFAKTEPFSLEYSKIIPLHFFGTGPQHKTTQIFLNPAGVGPLAYPQVNLNFGQNYFGYNYLSLATNIPVKPNINIGVGIEQFYCDDIPRTILTDEQRPEIDSYFGDRYTKITMGMYFPLLQNIHAGANIHMDHKELDDHTYEHIFGDMGLRFILSDQLTLGVFSDYLLKPPYNYKDVLKRPLVLDQSYTLEMYINLAPIALGHIYNINHNHTTSAEIAFGENISIFAQTSYDNKISFQSYSVGPIINLGLFGIQYSYKRILGEILDSFQHFLGIQVNFLPKVADEKK